MADGADLCPKVSDESTVPRCGRHHRKMHRHGNEQARRAGMQISPPPIAKDLRTARSIHGMARLVAWQDEIERTQIGQP